MANEFPKLTEVFKIGTEVTYDEAIEQVFLPQDNAVKSIPTISPIETVTLTENKIIPTVFLVQVKTVEELSNELHFIDYNNLRDGAILQLRILDNNNPIVIKNGISGVGSIMTADGNDIELNDYRTIVQLQLEGTLWRQVGGIQAQADWNQVDSKKPDFIKNKPTNLLDSTRITNCITEIPQDVKLELADGVLTLKAGSKVYVPNGFEDGLLKFDEVVISKDYTFSTAWNDKRMLFIRHNGDTDRYIDAYLVGQCHSGSTPPTGSQWMFWYDTSSNILKRTSDSGTTWDNYYSFPICIYNSDNGGITSIDQVFNGFGYIGSTVFALPGVKGLIPNGRNEDGSLKNDSFSITNVIPVPLNGGSNSNGRRYIYFTPGGLGILSSYKYDSQKNILTHPEDNSIINGCIAINFVWDNSQQAGQNITSFTPKLPFRAVDYNELNDRYGRNIGEIVQSTIPLTDAGLHLLDGSIIFGDGIYADFVNYIKNLTNNYPNLFVNEEAWQNTVNNKGVCGKFVYNSTNNTVRLPKITGFIEGTVDSNALGELIEAGLPNITGALGSFDVWGYGTAAIRRADGAFYFSDGKNNIQKTVTTQSNVAGDDYRNVSFNASRSSSIYGNSSTVQPQAIKVFYYIVIATLTKTDIEINTDNIITELNNKINNQDAVHKSGNETITGYKRFSDGIFVPEQSSTGTPISNVYVRKDNVVNCLKMGNGIIIQWGSGTANATLTYPIAFTSQYTYCITTTQQGHTDNTNNVTPEALTATSCFVRKNGVNAIYHWIAIGY